MEKREFTFEESLFMGSAEKMEVGHIYKILKVNDPYKVTSKIDNQEVDVITVETEEGTYYLPNTIVAKMLSGDFEQDKETLLKIKYLVCREFKSKFGNMGKSLSASNELLYNRQFKTEN